MARKWLILELNRVKGWATLKMLLLVARMVPDWEAPLYEIWVGFLLTCKVVQLNGI